MKDISVSKEVISLVKSHLGLFLLFKPFLCLAIVDTLWAHILIIIMHDHQSFCQILFRIFLYWLAMSNFLPSPTEIME